MKTANILAQWNFMRAIRLMLGVAMIVQAIAGHDVLIGVAGIVFAGMAIFNLGCCSTVACNTTSNNNNSQRDVTYEEVV